ncbi:MAG: DnaD domain protein [Lachnospiraceae bacterium]|nr:DnaD domain protein [Lachnospiraceae bacterium]
MGNITLCKDYSSEITIVSNSFIDRYMNDANDAQIKIYLYLLRRINAHDPLTVGDIADRFNYTEKDVMRALKYWDNKKAVSLSFNSSGSLTCIQMLDLKDAGDMENNKDSDKAGILSESFNVSSGVLLSEQTTDTLIHEADKGRIQMVDFSNKKNYTPQELMQFKSDPEISQLLFIAEAYLGKTLRPDEISSILFMYDSYGFSAELIEYLIEYCANNKKTNIKHIETVGRTWAETGISTVDEAKARTSNAPKEVYDVFRAFGISGRNPIEPEISYVIKWNRVYEFSIDIICEACSRTIMSIHSASFEYADTILTNWRNAGVKRLEDIAKLDAEHVKSAENKTMAKSQGNRSSGRKQGGSFGGFEQRKYDYSQLERDALMN